MPVETVPCTNCGGDGWYEGHAPPFEHDPDTGECIICPVQIECESCEGTGKIINGFTDEQTDMLKRIYTQNDM